METTQIGLLEFIKRVSDETTAACPDWLERLITYYAARKVHRIDFTKLDVTDLLPLPVWTDREITYLLPDCLTPDPAPCWNEACDLVINDVLTDTYPQQGKQPPSYVKNRTVRGAYHQHRLRFAAANQAAEKLLDWAEDADDGDTYDNLLAALNAAGLVNYDGMED